MDQSLDITAEELPIFQAEADDQLQILDEGMVRLEREDQDPELLQALFRAAHTLKGSAGMIGHKRMVELTHALEAALDGLRKETLEVTPDLIDTCLEAIDALRLLCEEVTSGESGQTDIRLLVERFAGLNTAGAVQVTGGCRSAGPTGSGQTTGTASRQEGDRPTLTVQAAISPDSIASAARAFQIMLALQEFGEIVAMQPGQEKIETAAPVSEFTAQVVPGKPVTESLLAEIRKAIADISEVDGLSICGSVFATSSSNAPAARVQALKEGKVRLGEVLLSHGLINETQLETAITMQKSATGPAPLLGQVLVQLGAISQEVLDQVIAEQNLGKRSESARDGSQAEQRSLTRSTEKTVRTSVERLDNLMNLVGELITDRNRLNLVRSALETRFHGDEEIEALAGTILHIGRITDQLQAEVMGIRMLPISNVFNKFPRMVRDLSRKANKQIDLVIRGEDTELDRSVIEIISDPLIHLLRNSVDHGIEAPQDRLAAGKPERGVIQLTARHEQGRIIVIVEDNGRGIDIKAVKARAVEKGLISPAEAESMPDDEAVDLIFMSGLSTAKVVSDVSGRGVGMDIVRSNLERLNGTIGVETWTGQGSHFQIILPLTLAIVPTLLVRVGVATYALPLVTINETLRVPLTDIQTVKGHPVIVIRDHVLPVMRLAEVFDLPCAGNGNDRSSYEYVVIVRAGKLQMGLVVDALVGEQEVVVKSLSSVLGEVTGISSAAILGDGQVALIIDVQGLFRLAALHPAHPQRIR